MFILFDALVQARNLMPEAALEVYLGVAWNRAVVRGGGEENCVRACVCVCVEVVGAENGVFG